MKLFNYNFIDYSSYNLFCKNEKLPSQKDIGIQFRKTTVSVDTRNYKKYLEEEIKTNKEIYNV
jgi:hypothetical protein